MAAAQRGSSAALITHLSLLFERLKRSKDMLPEERRHAFETILTLMADIRRGCGQPKKILQSLKTSWKEKVRGTAFAISTRFKELKSGDIEWTSRLTASIAYVRHTLQEKIKQSSTPTAPPLKVVLSDATSKKARQRVQNLPKSVSEMSYNHLWCLKNYSSLKAVAMRQGWSLYAAKKVFLAGHYFRPAVFFRKRGCLAEMHMSIVFEGLWEPHRPSWPFHEGVRLYLVHPTKRKDCMLFASGERESVSMHRLDSEEGVERWAFVSNAFFSLSDVEDEHYTNVDELNFVLAVLEEANNKPVKKRIVLL